MWVAKPIHDDTRVELGQDDVACAQLARNEVATSACCASLRIACIQNNFSYSLMKQLLGNDTCSAKQVPAALAGLEFH